MYGLPGYALDGIFCIVIGWLLKSIEFFPNKRIPLIVLPAGAVVNWLLAAPRQPDIVPRVYVTTNLVIGLAIAAIAWLAHDQFLKQIEDKIPLLGKLLSKTGDVVTPPAPTPPEPPKP